MKYFNLTVFITLKDRKNAIQKKKISITTSMARQNIDIRII